MKEELRETRFQNPEGRKDERTHTRMGQNHFNGRPPHTSDDKDLLIIGFDDMLMSRMPLLAQGMDDYPAHSSFAGPEPGKIALFLIN